MITEQDIRHLIKYLTVPRTGSLTIYRGGHLFTVNLPEEEPRRPYIFRAIRKWEAMKKGKRPIYNKALKESLQKPSWK